MPNSTDFQIFREAGFDGLNFAFIDGFRHYHSPTDTVSEIDRRSLQHQGENALALARHLADENLENVRAPDAIYFDIFGAALITYPASRAALLTLLTAVFFIGVVALGLKKRRLTTRGIVVGSITVLSSMCAACVVAALVRFVLGAWRGDESLASGDGLDMIALAAAGVAVASVLYVGVARRINALNLLAGGLLWWLIFLVLATLFSPGSTYLFTWPLLFNLVAAACIFLTPAGTPFALKHLSLLALGGLSGALLLVPVVYLASVALTPGSFGALVSSSASQALLLVPFSPHLSALFSPKRVNRP